MSEIASPSSQPAQQRPVRRRFAPQHPVAVLGQRAPVSLDKVLQVMHALTWLEEQCAHTDARWMDFKQGVAEAIYRDRIRKKANAAHDMQLRLGRVFGHSQAAVEQRWREMGAEARANNPRFAAEQQKADFDERIRAGLQQADIGIDAEGNILDAETARIMQSAMQYYCAGGCYNVAYAALPLKNSDILEMLAYIAEQRGPDTPVTIWNPNRQNRILNDAADAERQRCGDVALGVYLDVWSKLRRMLHSGQDAREQVLRRMGGAKRTRFFAQYGIDLDDPDQALIVAASLRRFCPPKRDQCQSRMRLTHALQPAQFVQLMRDAM